MTRSAETFHPLLDDRYPELLGRKGRLVVEFCHVIRDHLMSRTYCRCRCDCGWVGDIRRDTLLRMGEDVACRRCTVDVLNMRYDLTGRRFGRLAVTERTAERSGKNVVYRVRCDCGTEERMIGSRLVGISKWTECYACRWKTFEARYAAGWGDAP
jgi:hypothetical protein